MFLTVLIPGPRNPKDKLDVYLQPLIHELNLLWDYGVESKFSVASSIDVDY